ncbi:ATP-binding protein [Flammeovirga sp. MY04]|uniref:ATP-dependent nuclease n=1 Tax=Flammeovirga sp. MY04 TaxID=1191459 RepID=UPI0008062C63|nr:AAA family ATPase [Flammeovirga sp. MY04]ANQ52772.1 ATP-binding protein [Flammeovirga sp. MY04]
MKPRIWISKIEFSDTTELEFEKNQITVFVGPNNAGKSATLKELNLLTRSTNNNCVVLKNMNLEKDGTEEELLEFLKSNSMAQKDNSNPEPFYLGLKYRIYGGNLDAYWNNRQGLNDMQSLFVSYLSTEERLTMSNPPRNISLTKDAVKHPIHYMQKDDSIEFQFSSYFKQAFNQDLIVHRNAGNDVPLYIGERPVPKNGDDRVSINYIKEIEKLPLLHKQGDGMRSFVGILLSAFVSDYSLFLLDEPEAFLHPPQARLLGKMLANDLPKDKQLFLATHSGDFLKGLLDADIENLKIVRIKREGDINKISTLNNSEIKELWGDSLLRHSNILDGLFHSKVVICESDSDCRFYSAVLQSLYENDSNISPDVLFIHCGGKHRVSSIVKSLKKLDVDIISILDFDVLNSQNPLKDIFTECGGDWSVIENDWKQVKTSIDAKRPELETEDLKKEIIPILESTTERLFPKSKIKEINSLLKRVSAWSHAKQSGKFFIPSGNPMQAYQRLILELEKVGLLVVEVGELESFVKSIGNHGPKWVNEVLSKDLLNDPELLEAREFVKKIIKARP